MHAWRVNNEVYVQTRRDDLLRQVSHERGAAGVEASEPRVSRLAYAVGAALRHVGSLLVRLGSKLQGLLPEPGPESADIGADVLLGRPAAKKWR